VNFADELRKHPDISQLSFVSIAREVGRRWQELPVGQKRVWEGNAAVAMQEFEAEIDRYKKTDAWRRYQVYLNDFKTQHALPSTGKRPATSRSTTGSSNNTKVFSRAGSPPNSSVSSPSLSSTEADDVMTLALSELSHLRGEILDDGSKLYGAHNLPPEALVRKSMYAFVRGTGSLLFMWTCEQVDQVIERVYRPRNTVEAFDLAEVCTVVAMGAHYDSQCFTDDTRKGLYASASLYLQEQLAKPDHLRVMRLLLSMSFYALLEKHMSARYLIGTSANPERITATKINVAAGLQIARRRSPPSMVAEAENWRKIYRSLIFMDSWLSYTLGYISEVTPSDVQVRLNWHFYLAHLTRVDCMRARSDRFDFDR
jgi:hypothetical protein